MTYTSASAAETQAIAAKLAKDCKAGDVFCLCGDLGAGKTVFSKGFARGLDIEDEITSPTFNIINEYRGVRLPFYHFDVYRIEDDGEMDDTGYDEYFYDGGVCLIEWADKIVSLIPENATWISIEKDLSIDEDFRIIRVKK